MGNHFFYLEMNSQNNRIIYEQFDDKIIFKPTEKLELYQLFQEALKIYSKYVHKIISYD